MLTQEMYIWPVFDVMFIHRSNHRVNYHKIITMSRVLQAKNSQTIQLHFSLFVP